MLKILLKLFKNKRLKTEDRLLILNVLLDQVEALPIGEIITHNLDGTMQINGKALSMEQAIQLKEGAISLQNNWFYKVLMEQVTWEAVKFGVHSSLSIESILFSKAAIWLINQQKDLTDKISQIDSQ